MKLERGTLIDINAVLEAVRDVARPTPQALVHIAVAARHYNGHVAALLKKEAELERLTQEIASLKRTINSDRRAVINEAESNEVKAALKVMPRY